MPGHQHGSAGYAGRIWQHTRRLLEKHSSSSKFVNITPEAYEMKVNRLGRHAGLPDNWLKATGYKVTKVTEMYAEALIKGEGITPSGVSDMINLLTGHQVGSICERVYLRALVLRLPALMRRDPNLQSLGDLEMRQLASYLSRYF